jgi:hypothetical protein
MNGCAMVGFAGSGTIARISTVAWVGRITFVILPKMTSPILGQMVEEFAEYENCDTFCFASGSI